jgi:hypothetical protein
MSTTFNIEYHLSRSKIVVYLAIKRFYSSLGCDSLTPHILVDSIKFYRVRKALLVVHNLANAWSLCQLIDQVSSA